MITPADLARMLGQTPDSADSHTQDHLLYTSGNSASFRRFGRFFRCRRHREPLHQSGRSSRRSRRSIDCATFRCAWYTRNARHTRNHPNPEISDAASDMPAPKPMILHRPPSSACMPPSPSPLPAAPIEGRLMVSLARPVPTIAEVEPIIATAQTSVTIVTNDPAATAHAGRRCCRCGRQGRCRAHHSDTDSARRADAACGTYRTGCNAGHHAGLSASLQHQ